MAGWFRDDSKRKDGRPYSKKFATYELAVAAAERALKKAEANGEQTIDRFYVADGWDWYSINNYNSD